eukprot:934888-Amphidinium_carterae.1
MSPPGKCIDCIQKLPSYLRLRLVISSCTVPGLLTGFGLDFLAGQLSGPSVDRATLQLIGVLFASILLPGIAGAIVQNLGIQYRKMPKVLAVANSTRKEGRHAHE